MTTELSAFAARLRERMAQPPDAPGQTPFAALALERGSRILGTKLRGDEVLVIGDTPLDIRCARAIGAKALAVASGGADLAELERHRPDWAIADLRAITARAAVAGATVATGTAITGAPVKIASGRLACVIRIRVFIGWFFEPVGQKFQVEIKGRVTHG